MGGAAGGRSRLVGGRDLPRRTLRGWRLGGSRVRVADASMRSSEGLEQARICWPRPSASRRAPAPRTRRLGGRARELARSGRGQAALRAARPRRSDQGRDFSGGGGGARPVARSSWRTRRRMRRTSLRATIWRQAHRRARSLPGAGREPAVGAAAPRDPSNRAAARFAARGGGARASRRCSSALRNSSASAIGCATA